MNKLLSKSNFISEKNNKKNWLIIKKFHSFDILMIKKLLKFPCPRKNKSGVRPSKNYNDFKIIGKKYYYVAHIC